MPIVRLLVWPSLEAVMFYPLLKHALRMESSGLDKGFGMRLLIVVPFLVTFFSQLHRMDVLRRIERLEREIERLGISSSTGKP